MKNYKSKKRKNYNNLHAHNFLQSIFSTYLYLISSIHAFKFNSHATSTITSTNSDQLLQQIFSSLSDSYNSVNRANPSLSSSILKNVKNSIAAKSPILSQLDEIEILPQPDTINSPINHEFKSKHSNLKHLNKITLKQASQSSLHDISNSNSQITSNKYENTSSRKVKHNPVNSNNNFYRPKKYNQKSFGYICTAESETPFNIQDGLNQIGRDGITSNFANTRARLLKELEKLQDLGSYKDLEQILLNSMNFINSGTPDIMGRSLTPHQIKKEYPSSSRRISKFHHDPTYVKQWKCCNNARYDSLNLDCCNDLTVARSCSGFTQWSEWSKCPSKCGQSNVGKIYQTRKRNCIIDNKIMINTDDVAMQDYSFMDDNEDSQIDSLLNIDLQELLDLGLDVSSFADYDITLEDSNLYRKKRRKRSRIRRSSNSESINTDMFESEAEKFKFLNDHIFTEYTIDNTFNFGCQENLEEIKLCAVENGNIPDPSTSCWEEWSSWSTCNCELNSKMRFKQCPVFGNCEGESYEEDTCEEECKINESSNHISCFTCESQSNNEECINTAKMCNAKDFSPFGYNNINNLSAGTESGLNGSTTPGFSDHTINIGCQSQVIKSNGQQIINKSCSDIIDCYANSSEKLATGECDPDNPLDSNCIYCCEDEYCNYDSHFESSFFLILKMANWRKNRLVLKSSTRFNDSTNYKNSISRSTMHQMYSQYKADQAEIDRQMKNQGGSELKQVLDLAMHKG